MVRAMILTLRGCLEDWLCVSAVGAVVGMAVSLYGFDAVGLQTLRP